MRGIWVLWLLGAWLVMLMLTSCTQTPSGPTYDINGNTGPVTINTTNGSSSPVSSAPCGATASQKNAATGVPVVPAPNCSSTTTEP